MIYRLAADLVLLVHLAFVLFVALGAVAALRWPKVLFLQIPAVVWGVGIELVGGICPLTPLENRLLRLAGEEGYTGGFLEHYLLATLYPDGLTRGIQIGIGLAVATLNLVLWARLFAQRTSTDRR